MEKIVSFKYPDLHGVIYSAYRSICEIARSASLLHVSKLDNHPYYLESIVLEANNAITRLRGIYLETDEKRNELKFLNKEELIKKAEEFFKEDEY